jgi:HSP20 family protein
MSMTLWEPFRDMDEFFNRLAPMMGSRRGGDLTAAERQLHWSPSADISETDGEFRIRAELPGVKKDDVKVSIDNGVITLSGERQQTKEDKSEKFHRVERFYGSFSRSFALPDNADTQHIKAESKDGTLLISIPKLPASKPKQIEVQIN